jgi:hypothetical protein
MYLYAPTARGYPKMDNAQADDLYKTVGPNAMGQRVGGRGDREAALVAGLSESSKF